MDSVPGMWSARRTELQLNARQLNRMTTTDGEMMRDLLWVLTIIVFVGFTSFVLYLTIDQLKQENKCVVFAQPVGIHPFPLPVSGMPTVLYNKH
jgi:hypothetical protein